MWLILVFMAGAAALWFTGKASYGLWTFARLGDQATAQVRTWEIEERGPSKFALVVFYRYAVGGKEFEGRSVLDDPIHLNRHAAQSEINKYAKQSNIRVWIDPRRPAYSSFYKTFPMKKSLYALCSWGIAVYFFAARRYLETFSSIE